MIQAVFFDIDGTLRDFKEQRLSEDTKRALALARRAGLYVSVATGRHWLEIEEEGLLGEERFDAYVTVTGQLCYTCPRTEGLKPPGRPVHKNPIPPEQVERLLELLGREPFPCVFLEEDRMYMNYADSLVCREQEAIGTRIPPAGDIRRALHHPVYQIVPYGGPGLQEKVQAVMKGCACVTWHGGMAADVIPGDGSKTAGIQAVMKGWGLELQDAAAVGDGGNDVDMLRRAGLGIAMGNGCRAAKEAAGYITGQVGRGGLTQAVEYILAQNRREAAKG